MYPTLQSAPVTTRQGKTAPNWAGVGRRINLLLLNFPVRNILGNQTMTDLIKKKPNVRNLVMASKTRLTYNCAHLRSTKENLTFE